MSFLKSQFEFSKKDQIGILFLVILILIALVLYQYTSPVSTSKLDLDSDEVVAINATIDSLKNAEATTTFKRYPFNPNFISEFKAYTLGMSVEEYTRLKNFRDKDQWINSVADFKSVTQVSDSLLDTFKADFKFPDWVTASQNKPKYFKKGVKIKTLSYAEKSDLNTATEQQLQAVSGIGPALSKRIVNYRNKLGGFVADIQLNQVWGLDTIVVKRTLRQFTVKTPKNIKKYNVNTATASDIATIPGISFELAKDIWEFRVLRERIESLEELSKISTVSTSHLGVIKLYLYVE